MKTFGVARGFRTSFPGAASESVRQEGPVENPAIARNRRAAGVEREGSGAQDGNPHRWKVDPSGRPPGVAEYPESGHGSENLRVQEIVATP